MDARNKYFALTRAELHGLLAIVENCGQKVVLRTCVEAIILGFVVVCLCWNWTGYWATLALPTAWILFAWNNGLFVLFRKHTELNQLYAKEGRAAKLE